MIKEREFKKEKWLRRFFFFSFFPLYCLLGLCSTVNPSRLNPRLDC